MRVRMNQPRWLSPLQSYAWDESPENTHIYLNLIDHTDLTIITELKAESTIVSQIAVESQPLDESFLRRIAPFPRLHVNFRCRKRGCPRCPYHFK